MMTGAILLPFVTDKRYKYVDKFESSLWWTDEEE
jgi:hypothetical protein